MAGLSPTQRTLRALRQEGKICAIVERYLSIPGRAYGVRQDLFGIIDVLALDPQHGIVGIQSTGTAFAEHLEHLLHGDNVVRGTDMTPPELCREWLLAGGRLELWGWRRIKKKRGGKLLIWKPRVKVFSLDDFK